MSINAGGSPPLLREDLIAWIDRLSNQNGQSDAALCKILNRHRARSASGDFITIDEQTLKTLRNGGPLGDSRMRHIAEALEREFGAQKRPVLPAVVAPTRKLISRVPIGRTVGVIASLVLLGIYLAADDAIKRKFEGTATVISILPVVLACFLVLDIVRKRK